MKLVFLFFVLGLNLFASELKLDFNYTNGPHINERGQRLLSEGIATIHNKDDNTKLDQAYFYLWMKMPTMQHGGRPISMEYLGGGMYQITNILLVKMPGQWFLRAVVSGKKPANPQTDFDLETPISPVF